MEKNSQNVREYTQGKISNHHEACPSFGRGDFLFLDFLLVFVIFALVKGGTKDGRPGIGQAI